MATVKYPAAPKHLDKIAKDKWKQLVKILDLKPIDLEGLEQYCSLYSTWTRAEQALAEHGFTQRAEKSKYENQRPEVAISSNALARMMSLQKELGMTKASRSRIDKNAGGTGKEEKAPDPEMEGMIS